MIKFGKQFRFRRPAPPADTRLKRLAENIDALETKDQSTLRRAREIGDLRRAATAELYGICSDFVSALNRLLSRGEIILSPSEFSEGDFRENSIHLVQIHVRGRILQVEFQATPELVSTEDFRIPYTLNGLVRAFNQELLDQDVIEERLIFYTLEKHGNMWRFFDARTYRSGPFDQDYLTSLMEELL